MKNKIHLTKEQAKEMYYNINNFKLFLNGAEQIDKCFFKPIRFWTPTLNQHLKRSRESIDFIQNEFNRHFKPIDNDLIEFEAPSSLYRVLDFFGRLHPDNINIIMDDLEKQRDNISKRSSNLFSKKVIDLNDLKIYKSAKEYSEIKNVDYNKVRNILNKKVKNIYNIIKHEEYIKLSVPC